MKKGFTLIEMLVVIGIIGLLMSVLVVYVTGGSESARAAQCLTNLANLARGCTQYGSVSGRYPLAGSIEQMTFNSTAGIRNARESYSERPGWVSWASMGAYRSGASSHIANGGWFTSAYDEDDRKREYCLTNGVLWKYVSANASCYRCPCHTRKVEGKARPNWSYVMNSYFGWDDSNGQLAKDISDDGIWFADLKRADRRLLFAEMKWEAWQGEPPDFSPSPGIEHDSVLQYRSEDGGETIAWNHKSGRDKVAHVVFADGHVEKLTLPKKGLSNSEARDLTTWLCQGKDVSFDGTTYREMKN